MLIVSAKRIVFCRRYTQLSWKDIQFVILSVTWSWLKFSDFLLVFSCTNRWINHLIINLPTACDYCSCYRCVFRAVSMSVAGRCYARQTDAWRSRRGLQWTGWPSWQPHSYSACGKHQSRKVRLATLFFLNFYYCWSWFLYDMTWCLSHWARISLILIVL